MSAHSPEELKYAEYFGHDKVSLVGVGGLPAAPPAPPGSNARRAGETALADAMSKVGTPGPRPGSHPAATPPKPHLKQAVRFQAERASMEASERAHTAAGRGIAPHASAGWFWRSVFVPVYGLVPWALRRRMMRMASGVRSWSTR